MSRRALLAGASGLVGSGCLQRLLANGQYTQVVALVRRPLPLAHEKLTQAVVDFDRLESTSPAGPIDDVYCCLGTTIRKAGSQAAFRRVDFDYPVALARAARTRGASRFLLVSALGADPSSRVFYNRVKGEVEEAVRSAGIEQTWFFRPSLLLGERAESRPAERAGIAFARLVSPLLRGPLFRYRAVEADAVAAAMISVALHGHPSGPIESDEIARLALR
jgi:uncharacterized protein YbjT (DUF2867 family)